MNRIRRIGNVYQCLLTPHRKYDIGFEYLIGSWTDESIRGFEVITFNSLNEAECVAIDMPDINWDMLVDFHKDSFLFLKEHISQVINKTNIAVDFTHYLATPNQTKNRMFDRVMRGREILTEKQSMTGFRLVYNMNDIISFVIVNPWMKNLKILADRLIKTDRLKIFNKIEKDGIIQLVGRTDIDTTYEIILASSVIHNWMLWIQNNPMVSLDMIKSTLRNCIRTQHLVDTTPILR
jgi:hypothetical protein